jgi:hypothetical protein
MRHTSAFLIMFRIGWTLHCRCARLACVCRLSRALVSSTYCDVGIYSRGVERTNSVNLFQVHIFLFLVTTLRSTIGLRICPQLYPAAYDCIRHSAPSFSERVSVTVWGETLKQSERIASNSCYIIKMNRQINNISNLASKRLLKPKVNTQTVGYILSLRNAFVTAMGTSTLLQ